MFIFHINFQFQWHPHLALEGKYMLQTNRNNDDEAVYLSTPVCGVYESNCNALL